VADIFRHFGPAFRDQHGAALSGARRRAMIAIESCRTAALGGHVERCGECGHQRIAYDSCRNRNCPKCQGLARAKWIADRQAELLDVPYFHVVFTVPTEIEVIAFQNQTVVYDILFRAASETLCTIAADPEHLGAEIGFFGVLHTWGQNLLHHPHIHFLVPGGGIAPDGEHWIACRPGFFLPVKVLSHMFRGKVLHYLGKAFSAGELNFSPRTAICASPPHSVAICSQFGTPGGWSTPSGRSPDRHRSSTTLGGIPTASPSPTIAWCPWTTARSGSAGRTIGMPIARRS
jgi:Transposase zinc-binding domain/Putative transposase